MLRSRFSVILTLSAALVLGPSVASAGIIVRVLAPQGTHNNKAQLSSTFSVLVGVCVSYSEGIGALYVEYQHSGGPTDLTSSLASNDPELAPGWCQDGLGTDAEYWTFTASGVSAVCGDGVIYAYGESTEAGPPIDDDGQWVHYSCLFASNPSARDFSLLKDSGRSDWMRLGIRKSEFCSGFNV
jgi:hypothetical protein